LSKSEVPYDTDAKNIVFCCYLACFPAVTEWSRIDLKGKAERKTTFPELWLLLLFLT